MTDKKDDKSFWTTLPGILTGFAALLTAIGGLVTALYTAGILQFSSPTPGALGIRVTPTVAPTQFFATATVVNPTIVPPPTSAIPPTTLALTSLPSSTPTPTTGADHAVENFENYSPAFVQENFKVNRNADNDLNLHLVGVPHVGQGNQALAFEYNIRNAPPRQYVGFDRDLPIQDWTKYSKLCAWVESDGSNRNLVIQFGEHNNNFRKSNFPLSTRGATDYCVSLNTQPSIDLRLIGYYGIYVEGPPQGQGAIYIDNIRLLP